MIAKLFHPVNTALMTLIGCWVLGHIIFPSEKPIYVGPEPYQTWLTLAELSDMFIGLTVFAMLHLLIKSHKGWGVKKTIRIGDTPIVICMVFAYFTISSVCTLMEILMNPHIELSPYFTHRDQVSYAYSTLLGLFMGISHWYLYAMDAYYYFDEAEIRSIAKRDGKTPEQIEQEIRRLRAMGKLPPTKPS